jgi:diguanylate cyclase (GGDEF)-like protein
MSFAPTMQSLPSTGSLLSASRADFELSSHEEGERVARAALAQAFAEGDVDAQREALWLISLHADRCGRLAAAAGAGEQALGLRVDGATSERARLHCHLARIYDALDLDALNLRHATAAFDIARQCDDVPLLCLTLSRLGVARSAARDWSAGTALIEQALGLARTAGDVTEVFRALNNLSVVLQYSALAAKRRGDAAGLRAAAEEGVAYAGQAVAQAEAIDDPYLTAIALLNRCSGELELDHVAEARRDCDAALAVSRQHRYTDLVIELEHLHGRLMVLEGDAEGGLAHMERTLEIVESGDFPLLARQREDLYMMYKRVGDTARTLAHHEAMLALERGRADRRADAEYKILLERAEVQRVAADAESARREAERERDRASRLQDERDVFEARANEMGRHALEDALTGLPNRRRVYERMEIVLARTGGANGTVSIGVIDLDRFKSINDRFGHGVGDDVLRAVGAILNHGLRDSDLVGRVGGEEFVLLLDRTPLEVGIATCERLRRAIESYDWATLRPGLAVTASIGLWTADAPVTVRAAMERADSALYAAKAAGRNRVVV